MSTPIKWAVAALVAFLVATRPGPVATAIRTTLSATGAVAEGLGTVLEGVVP